MHVSILLQPNFILLQLGRLMNLPREKIRKVIRILYADLRMPDIRRVKKCAGGNN